MSLKKMLKERVSCEELSKLRRSFEIIGDVVIIDLPDDVIHLKDLVVEAILKKHKHVKTILRKAGGIEGVYRIARYEVLYGGETETIVKEYGCRFLVDPTKVYYSVRLSGERERIAKLVKPGERVLVMFAGVGPYAIIIAKLAKPSEVIGVEINPKAVEYFRKNIKLNKVDVKVYEGDVREVVSKLEGKFDRILMPSPHIAENFVDAITGKIKKGGYIHYYTFASEEEMLPKKIKELFRTNGIEVEVEKLRTCGNFAPYVNRYVLDLKVLDVQR
jgi:tRNA (guanine37-N1)-methyltransferase